MLRWLKHIKLENKLFEMKKAELQSCVAKADSAKAISDRKSLTESTFQELDDAMAR